ncbi:MAG: SGNH/GDSL hydrolase family protein [Candidatus Cryptobacteroides sp.]
MFDHLHAGYNTQPCPGWPFIARMKNIVAGNPDLILIFGGTNDSWANSHIDEFKFFD